MSNKKSSNNGWSTRAIHAGENKRREHRPLITPIYQTATFSFETCADLNDYYQGQPGAIAEYGRYGNPTRKAAEEKLASLENAAECDVFPSGMSAIVNVLYFTLSPGDHLIFTSDNYRGTRKFIETYLSRLNIEFSIVPVDLESIQEAVTPKTKVIFTELPTNPFQFILDLSKLAELCKTRKILSVVDATLASPYNINPLDFGIDLVTHSLTKYLSGHNDLILGAVLGNDSEFMGELRKYHNLSGGHTDPQALYLLLRGLKTFPLRMERHNSSSLKIARWLQNRKNITAVHYPGLESHRDYALASSQMRGFGGIISFEPGTTQKHAEDMCNALEIIAIAASLGGVESLVHPVRIMSFSDCNQEELKQYGIPENLVRLAVGLEDADDLIQDLETALQKAGL
ncbi:MAG: aminotransferase class I/II-fold pyridoxal phosphate-dependent enzyme [Leptospiraceae bacterium]|nr:aminotransferase class I/II-fold pyridoxal phosphate-dependent enzyme [Leptospiraceae bacterium]